MRTAAQRAGDAAEANVAAYLAEMAWQILGTHVRVGRAEIDIIATDPGPPATLAIVEVRWRAGRAFGLPEETIDRKKRVRIHAAGHLLRELGALPGGVLVPRLPLRFDLVVLEPGDRLRHYRHGL
jgi:putative endonuclease